MSVFVSDGEQRATLAVVRSLGRAGIPVVVGSVALPSLAGSSRFCKGRVTYPSPTEQPRKLQQALRKEMKAGKYDVLIPMTDITTMLVAQMRTDIEPFARVPLSTSQQIQSVRDKGQILSAAQAIGIACPRIFGPINGESLEALAARLSYPVVLKPRFSWTEANGKWIPTRVEYAHSAADFLDKYERAHSLSPNPLVQQRIHGEGRGVFLLIWNGELKAAFCHRRLREKPPWGGVSVYRESIPLDPGIVDKSYKLLQKFGWQGPAMVEFKVDNRDGELKLMEVNGRFWGSLQLALDSGMDFPLLYYRLAMDQNPPNQFSYRVGVRSRWLLGDLDQLLTRLRHASAQNGFPGRQPSKLRATLEFMKFYEPKLHYEILRFEDPGPGWYECRAYVRALMHRPAAKEIARGH